MLMSIRYIANIRLQHVPDCLRQDGRRRALWVMPYPS